ncbi:MAG: hypothetical protein E3J25_06685 [Anaerolineales bacterium]|nr:MAG: hypothetical protein E3J25_06685 [Anaerolineales bacterium]
MSFATALEEFVNEVEKVADVEKRRAGATPSDREREEASRLRDWIEDVRTIADFFCALERGDDMQEQLKKPWKFAGGGPLINFYGERQRL